MKIIENVLPVEQADFLEEMLMSKTVQWSYIRDSSGTIPDGERQFPSFSRPVVNMSEPHNKFPDREMWIRLDFPTETICKKAGLDVCSLSRIRLGMHVPDQSWTSYHGPHRDQPGPHTVVLYYVNDSDGDTYFFDDDEQVIDRITPKKNTMVVFDGLTLHASSYPTKGQRITINYNFN